MKWNILLGTLVLGFGLSTQSFGFDLLDRMLGVSGSGCESSCCETKCGADVGCAAATSCCDTPACGHRGLGLGLFHRHGRGCNDGCGNGCEVGCAADPGCAAEAGCAADPGCGAAAACGSCNNNCGNRCRKPLFAGLFSCRKSCNNGCGNGCEVGCGANAGCGADAGCAADPGCGAAASCCEPVCKKRCRPALLDRIFACRRSCGNGCGNGCDNGCEAACGVSGPAPAHEGGDAGEAAPMPPAPVVDPSAYQPTKRRVVQASMVR